MSNVLEVSKLVKIFNGKKKFVAVNNISFSISAGEIVGLLGPNGAGKTTTIQMLLGTLTPTSGSIKYFGLDFATNRSKSLESVGYANGYGKLPWNLTVNENLVVQGMLYGLHGKALLLRIGELLERFEIADKARTQCHSLSAGQLTRVMLAKAFIGRPKVVLLDEPTAALDPDIGQEIRKFVLEEKRERGVAMIYTSHNMKEVSEICDRVIFLRSGEIVEVDTPEQLAAKAALTKMRIEVSSNYDGCFNFIKNEGVEVNQEGKTLLVSLERENVPKILTKLALSGFTYDRLEIQEPTLEDYFIKISKEQKAYELA